MGAEDVPPAGRFADLKARIVSATIASGIAVALLAAGGLWAALLVGAMAAALVWEWRSITRHGGGRCGVDAVLPVAGAALAVLVTHFAGGLAGLGVLALVALLSLVGDRLAGRDAAGLWIGLGVGYLGAASIAFLWIRETDPFGVLACIWIVLVVAASDVGGYFAGRAIGGPKLWPRVSPKKTWAGAGGSVTLAFLLGGVFSWATTGTYYGEVCTVSAVCSVFAQAGDLAESALKRRFGVKDSGHILPGHGGLFDRLDGLIAATLVVAVVTLWRGQTVFIWS